jgi:hypothetical protein
MQELLRSRLEQGLVSRSGLSNADYTVLAVLSEAPERRMRPFDLSRTLGWEKSRLHHQVRVGPSFDEAAAAHPGQLQIVLTRDGLAAIVAAAPEHVRDVRLLLDALTDEQLAQLGEISRAIIARLITD